MRAQKANSTQKFSLRRVTIAHRCTIFLINNENYYYYWRFLTTHICATKQSNKTAGLCSCTNTSYANVINECRPLISILIVLIQFSASDFIRHHDKCSFLRKERNYMHNILAWRQWLLQLSIWPVMQRYFIIKTDIKIDFILPFNPSMSCAFSSNISLCNKVHFHLIVS